MDIGSIIILAIIIVILFIFGNITLFSDVFGNDWGAWFLALCAMVVDIILIFVFIRRIKNRQTAKITEKVKELTAKYSLNNIKTNTSALSLPFELNHSLINHEITFAVNSYKERMRPIYEKYMHIFNETKKILACNGCNSIKEKYLYLLANEEKLTELKNKGDSYYSQLSSYRIELLNEDCILLPKIKQAFLHLLNSKKCRSNLSVKDLVTNKKPYELKLFKYSEEPCILLFEQCYFCLFSHVIFIFDKNGIFSTAIDPSALQLNVKRETETILVTLRDRNSSEKHWKYADSDSRCISQGTTTRSTYLHSCIDGSPDRRYNYNPRVEYRYDTYEYIIIELMLFGKKVSFLASSSKTGDAFEEVMFNYARKYNDRHDSILEFLTLIKLLNSTTNARLEKIIQSCAAKAETNSYFCRLITL